MSSRNLQLSGRLIEAYKSSNIGPVYLIVKQSIPILNILFTIIMSAKAHQSFSYYIGNYLGQLIKPDISNALLIVHNLNLID
jgi:hypothetical protein